VGEDKLPTLTLIIKLICFLVSSGLGIYSTRWSLTNEDASGVDLANSLALLYNAYSNAHQAWATKKRYEDVETHETWSGLVEAILTAVTMIVALCAVKDMGADDFVACFVTVIIAVDGMLDTFVDFAVEKTENKGGMSYYSWLVFSVAYNTGLAVWAGMLIGEANTAWKDGDGENYDAEKKTWEDKDFDTMFKDVQGEEKVEYLSTNDGNYCY